MVKFCADCGKQLQDSLPCECGLSSNDVLCIFENEIMPCDEEVKVKAYHVAELRTRFLRRRIAAGLLIVTNLRVIYRTEQTKRSKDFIHSEVPIQDVSGVLIKKGRFIDFIATLIAYSILALLIYAPRIISFFGQVEINTTWYGVAIVAILTIAYIFHYRMFSIDNLLSYLKSIFRLFIPIRPLLSFKVVSKGGIQGGIDIVTSLRGRDWSAENAPLNDIHLVSSELGAIINSVQKGTFNLAEIGGDLHE